MTARPFPWEKSYPPILSWDTPLEVTTVPALLDGAVAVYGARPAIDYRGTRLSFADLGARADEAAAAFLHAGIGRGQTLALYLPNTAWQPIAFFAGLRTAARLVLLSPLDAEAELAYKLKDAGARVLVTTDIQPMFAMALRLLDGGHVERLIVCPEATLGAVQGEVPTLPIPDRPDVVAWTDFARGITRPANWPPLAPSDLALLQYTGGTTGRPKGAMLTHANLTAACAIFDAWYEGGGGAPAEGAKVIGVLPLFHIYALTVVLLRNVQRGAEILLRLRFDVETTLRDIEVMRANSFPGVPTMWLALLNHPGIETRDLSALAYAGSGGAPLPVEAARRFEALTGRRMLGGWGMTETSPAGTSLLADGPPKPGSIGLPMPGIEMDVVALDDPTRVLGPNETGEIRIKGPNVVAGYWNRPEETAAAFADGRLLTGDVGYMDEDGYFFIVDRKKDMIISGGFNVYPQMVEQAIYTHPAVAECLVVGVPDAYRGESAKAFVVLRPGAAAFTLQELQAFLADKVGRHEMPRDLEFRDALPKTAVGKFSKVALRDEERARVRAGAA
ncbi:MAG TPA: dicarboxylate--CoA ligase PimA [Hyphomicrobiales bacterium]|nr:dicarboxylate--CoA ligase PimA [Hyphomicrobiales bacterium]